MVQPLPPAQPPDVPWPDTFAGPNPPEGLMVAVVLMVGLIVTGVILFPLIRAWARKIEGKTSDPTVLAEVEHLRSRVTDLEQVHHRVAELEERLDFSERLLSQSRDPQAVRVPRDGPE